MSFKLVTSTPTLTNTERRVLGLLRQRRDYGATIMDLVSVMWPQSKQPLKKCKTTEAIVRRLADMDMALMCYGGASSFRYTEARWKAV